MHWTLARCCCARCLRDTHRRVVPGHITSGYARWHGQSVGAGGGCLWLGPASCGLCVCQCPDLADEGAATRRSRALVVHPAAAPRGFVWPRAEASQVRLSQQQWAALSVGLPWSRLHRSTDLVCAQYDGSGSADPREGGNGKAAIDGEIVSELAQERQLGTPSIALFLLALSPYVSCHRANPHRLCHHCRARWTRQYLDTRHP